MLELARALRDKPKPTLQKKILLLLLWLPSSNWIFKTQSCTFFFYFWVVVKRWWSFFLRVSFNECEANEDYESHADTNDRKTVRKTPDFFSIFFTWNLQVEHFLHLTIRSCIRKGLWKWPWRNTQIISCFCLYRIKKKGINIFLVV